MQSFGAILRLYRRQCQDPLRGGPLTQVRLGELLGHYLGDLGYSGAAVSDWERNKSKISEDDRLVLVSLIRVLYEYGGLKTPEEADELLFAGNYRALNAAERQQLFPELSPESSSISETEPKRTGSHYATRERKNQLVLLDKVYNFWVRGVFEHSIQEATLIDLTRQRFDEAIEHPWRDIVSPAEFDKKSSVSGPLIPVMRDADNALLILGDPGAGKTTTLLQLTGELAVLARQAPKQAIPVILNMASWTEKRQKISDWAVEDIAVKYQIPRRMGRDWLENQELILLLDGFDEVPPNHRAACAKAINLFRESHGLTNIVVCSRTQAYASCGVLLRLSGAILLQPLTPVQVDDYLQSAGPKMDKLRKVVRQEKTWQQLAKSPLMLSVMRLAYEDEDAGSLLEDLKSDDDDAASTQRYLFDAYVNRMFQRRDIDPPYSSTKTKTWLGWLAREMTVHNQTLLLVEQLQPSWLPSRFWQWAYLLTIWLVNGLLGGIIMWLFLELLVRIVPPTDQWSTSLAESVSSQSILTSISAFLLLVNLALALVIGVVNIILFEIRRGREEEESAGSDRQGWRQLTIVGVMVFLATLLLVSPVGVPALSLSLGIAEAVMYVAISRYGHGRNYSTEIRMVEALTWSWPRAAKGALYGLALVAIAEIIETWLFGYNGFWRTGVIFTSAGLLLGGLSGSRLQVKSRPNEGIILSFRNSIIAALIAGSAMCLITLIVRRDSDIVSWIITGLLTGLLISLFTLPLYGAINVTKHYLVRLILAAKGYLPWDFVKFLNYASRLVLLRKVGGGNIFIHRLLQEYFEHLRSSKPL